MRFYIGTVEGPLSSILTKNVKWIDDCSGSGCLVFDDCTPLHFKRDGQLNSTTHYVFGSCAFAPIVWNIGGEIVFGWRDVHVDIQSWTYRRPFGEIEYEPNRIANENVWHDLGKNTARHEFPFKTFQNWKIFAFEKMEFVSQKLQ